MSLLLEKPVRVRSPRHLAWIRTQRCLVPSCRLGPIEAHHERRGTGGGGSMRPGDDWAVPLCLPHHHQGHTIGWRTFEARYQVGVRRVAEAMALASPVLFRVNATPNPPGN